VEREDLTLLEDLLEEFDSFWERSGAPLLKFIEDVWSRRMDGILAEKNKPVQGELEKTQELGVVLVNPAGPLKPPSPVRRRCKPDWE
jgi:hypothetical protein